jgi:hypothetical protein
LCHQTFNDFDRLIRVCPQTDKRRRWLQPDDLVMKLLGIISARQQLHASID